MAEVKAGECCGPEAQRSCCDPEDKSECCGATDGSCGCGKGKPPGDVQSAVRERYAAAAGLVSDGNDAIEVESVSCCGPTDITKTQEGFEDFGAELYSGADRDRLPDAAKLGSLGCGNPTAVADLHEGEIVLDLGCGGGIDVLLSAERVGETGKAYGLDMTDEMLELAQRNQREVAAENVEFLKGTIEDIPLPDDSIDVIISNCVINLSADKPAVFREAARVLQPGGRFAVSDIVADPDMDEATRADMEQWTGCIAGALTRDRYERELSAAGFDQVEVIETHRVHEHAGSAIVRARLSA